MKSHKATRALQPLQSEHPHSTMYRPRSKSQCIAGVSDFGLQELSLLTSLTNLNLDSRLFTDVGMRHLKGLTNLVALDLFAAKVSDIGCAYIR